MNERYSGTHKAVLIQEVLHYLNPQPGKRYLDVTFGAGGHTQAILEHEPQATVIAVDWDVTALETYGQPLREKYGDRLLLLWGNFSLLYKLLKKHGIDQVDGILADFGTSQMQIFNRPGFSFSQNTILDMRMAPSYQKITAAEIINTASEDELSTILFRYGQERHARKIARAVIEYRKIKPVQNTFDLVTIVEKTIGSKPVGGIHPATRVFQALRIVVNQELENIQSFLAIAPTILSVGGSLVCISFHSLEDSIVKESFRQKSMENILQILTPKVVTASAEELTVNASARSARLRAARRLKG